MEGLVALSWWKNSRLNRGNKTNRYYSLIVKITRLTIVLFSSNPAKMKTVNCLNDRTVYITQILSFRIIHESFLPETVNVCAETPSVWRNFYSVYWQHQKQQNMIFERLKKHKQNQLMAFAILPVKTVVTGDGSLIVAANLETPHTSGWRRAHHSNPD